MPSKDIEQLRSLLTDCGLEDGAGKTLLEVGFKNGLFLEQCHKAGLKATGLEVVEEFYENVKSQFPHLNLILYDGNKVPLPDASFDLVVSFQVLEHVGSPAATLDECVRLLKPGGMMYHVFPNYHSFYEGHYKVLWLPFLNQRLGRWYLKLRRRYTPYYETLNILKPKEVKRTLARYGDDLEVLSLGRREFLDKFTENQINKIDQKLLRTSFKAIHRLKGLKAAVLKTIAALDLYYPVTIIAEKK
jgi:SAM-dependent methyltransferase